MTNIRPISDLRNKFSEIEAEVLKKNEPVILTKNGYGTMVLLSIGQYDSIMDGLELKAFEADILAEADPTRLSHEEVFDTIRKNVDNAAIH